jgi:hypothetical protein
MSKRYQRGSSTWEYRWNPWTKRWEYLVVGWEYWALSTYLLDEAETSERVRRFFTSPAYKLVTYAASWAENIADLEFLLSGQESI